MSKTKRRALRHAGGWACAAMLLLAMAACQRDVVDPAAPPAEPVAAVQAMARAIADNDLVAYARLSVPPAQYAALEQAWSQGHSRWPLTELPLHDQLLPMLQALSADDGSQRLQRSFDRQLAGQTTAVRQAAQSMGLFGVQYLRHETSFTSSQQAHYVQVVETLAAWAADAPISDRARARASIAALTRAASATGLSTDDQLQQAGMAASLQRLGPFIATLKAVLASYGLDLDASMRGIVGDILSQQGDNALVRLQYPLAGQTISLQIPLTRREGHWYLTRTLADTDALLRNASAARAKAEAESAALIAPAAETGDDAKPPATP
ncbi:hypothetical protein M2410_002656 [Stenotrophomonas chelatiphaga]|jgi:hypothetical protein|uniref:hypothetical protein n=1 Tax=Stenotrophomonas chelatiphaga TaxID=517011 RepID=UPI0021693CE9|nr:hypothetical protein [Stenotrophomonas chelatiphaga]MCS4231901.1 hypothetical protein [Stenotrophomonas chelatiphaga]